MDNLSPSAHSLLRTKLSIPVPRANMVSRARLLQTLSKLVEPGVPLALIAAPAGFGKTTIVSEWLDVQARVFSPLRIGWLALDESDNDPARFLNYLSAAIEPFGLDSTTLAQLRYMAQMPQPQLDTFLTYLCNVLYEELASHAILVLDDYHLIQAKPIHDVLGFLVEHAPRMFHLVLTTRVDPPLPLALWRARGLIVELRDSDLRFTDHEASHFLTGTMGLTLRPAKVDALHERTDGWIAGLQMAALSLQGSSDTDRAIDAFTGSHRYIMDYLVEEVLQNQPETIQQFLLHTSILGRLSGPLCDAVTGRADSEMRLAQLEHNNLFVTALDNVRAWYRYHPLFADVLRHRLRLADAASIQALHHRASEWFEQQGLAREAIHHALTANDQARAAGLIEQITDAVLNQGETTTLQGWLSALPDAQVRTRARLCLARANAFVITGEIDLAEPWVLAAEDAAQSSPQRRRLLSEAAAIRAGLALYRNDLPHTIELATSALAGLSSENVRLRGAVMLYLGFAYGFSDRIAEAGETFTESARQAYASQDWHTALIATQNQAWVFYMQGKLRQAAQVYKQALALAVERGASQVPAVGGIHWELGRVMYEWNELEQAERQIQIGIDGGEQGKLPRMLLFSSVFMARLKLAQQDVSAASMLLERAQTLVEKFNLSLRYAGNVSAEQVRFWLATGNLDAASAWLKSTGLGTDWALDYLHEVLHLAVARVLLADGEIAQALTQLSNLEQAARTVGRMGTVIECLILQAIGLKQSGDKTSALRSLENALTLGEPEGYLRSFTDEGTAIHKLLGLLRAEMVHRVQDTTVLRLADYCERILDTFTSSQNIAASATRTAPHSPATSTSLLEPLTERELQVLHLLALGYTNQQISAQLFISLGTAKKHLNNIFGKLSATSRTQALIRARELSLIQ